MCCTITNYIHWYVFIPFFLSFLFFIPLFLSSCSLHYFLSLSLAFHMTCILCKVWRAFISVLLPFMWIAAGAVALRSYSYTSKRHMCKIFRVYLRIDSRDGRTYFPYRRNCVFFLLLPNDPLWTMHICDVCVETGAAANIHCGRSPVLHSSTF